MRILPLAVAIALAAPVTLQMLPKAQMDAIAEHCNNGTARYYSLRPAALAREEPLLRQIPEIINVFNRCVERRTARHS